METVKKTHQRSRSRSKTPTTEAQYRTTRSGRKTPVGISTNQLLLIDDSIIVEESEDMFTSPPAHRTRNMTKQTSDYSSEEPDTSPERVTSLTKEELQNIKNYSYNEHIYTTRSEKSDTIQSTQDVTRNYSRSRASPSQSDSSFKSSFAELTLADVSRIKETDPSDEYLPYKLYKYAGEYWNKYPKTDYTYSTYSKDYVELAPGQPAMPNMSRRSLHNFRLYGASTDTEEVDYISTSSAMADSLLKKSWNNYEGIRNRLNYQEDAQPLFNGMKYKYPMQNGEDERYWFTRILINIWTKIVTTVTTTTNNNTTDIDLDLYPYYYGNQSSASSAGASFLSRIGSALAAPFIYATSFISHYTSVKSVSTATRFLVSPIRKRKFWYFLIPLLLLLASYYVYENPDSVPLPSFEDFQLNLHEFSLPEVKLPGLPEIPTFNFSISDISLPNVTLPKIVIPEMPDSYYEYKIIISDKFSNVSDYLMIVLDSSYEEMRRYFDGIFG